MLNMDIVTVSTYGAELQMPHWLSELWPDEKILPLSRWPTYCGAGSGIGDWLVPDRIYGVRIPPNCLIHDLDWATADGSRRAFTESNSRFRKNLRAFTAVHVPEEVARGAWCRCWLYYVAVSTVGWKHYQNSVVPGVDIYKNETVRDRLARLAASCVPLDRQLCEVL